MRKLPAKVPAEQRLGSILANPGVSARFHVTKWAYRILMSYVSPYQGTWGIGRWVDFRKRGNEHNRRREIRHYRIRPTVCRIPQGVEENTNSLC
jgi:hypothetical protein